MGRLLAAFRVCKNSVIRRRTDFQKFVLGGFPAARMPVAEPLQTIRSIARSLMCPWKRSLAMDVRIAIHNR
jgi:hypothetical protein